MLSSAGSYKPRTTLLEYMSDLGLTGTVVFLLHTFGFSQWLLFLNLVRLDGSRLVGEGPTIK